MSSCLATTSRLSERPSSGGSVSPAAGVGVSCAVATRATMNVARAIDEIMGTRRVPTRIGLSIEFLFSQGARRRSVAAVNQLGGTDLKPWAARASGRADNRGEGGWLVSTVATETAEDLGTLLLENRWVWRCNDRARSRSDILHPPIPGSGRHRLRRRQLQAARRATRWRVCDDARQRASPGKECQRRQEAQSSYGGATTPA